MSRRAYDIVVMGATGYSGKLVCQHLGRVGDNVSWAIAGRDAKKLKDLAQNVLKMPTLATIVADTSDSAALDALCRQTTVVIACAGPFDLVGMPVVDACVRCGTHYVDITGESQYVRKVIEKHDAAAKSNGLMLVPCCGFDCVPSEMGNWLIHRAAEEGRLGPVRTVRAYFSSNGAPSGGTMASIANLFSTMERKDFSPVSLNPSNAPKVDAPTTKSMSFCGALQMWQGPYIMAAINERIVRRSNALAGRSAAYVEASVGRFSAVFASTAFLYIFGALMVVPLIRRLLVKYVFPSQGTGPTDAELAKSKFRGVFRGEVGGSDDAVQGKAVIEAVVRDSRGAYLITGVFAAESALCVVDLVKRGVQINGGVLTPSTAFGELLHNRIRAQGVECSVRVLAPNETKKSA